MNTVTRLSIYNLHFEEECRWPVFSWLNVRSKVCNWINFVTFSQIRHKRQCIERIKTYDIISCIAKIDILYMQYSWIVKIAAAARRFECLHVCMQRLSIVLQIINKRLLLGWVFLELDNGVICISKVYSSGWMFCLLFHYVEKCIAHLGSLLISREWVNIFFPPHKTSCVL